MRLLIVSQYFWPENFRINDLAAEMVRRGHEVIVLTGVPNYPSGTVDAAYRRNPERYEMYEGVRIVRVPMMTRGRRGLQLILNYLSFALSATIVGLWKLRGQPFDTILVYEPSPITVGIPGVVMRAVKQAPLAFWVLDLWPETLEAVGVVKSAWQLRVVGKLVSFIYKRSDLILAQSRSFIPQIRCYAGTQRRVEYFPSWAESLFDDAVVDPAPEVPIAPQSFTVMFAGNIGEAQDFPAILAAAEALKVRADIRWLVLGDGRLSEWVAKEVERRDLGCSIQLLGRYPVERMPSFFRHADVLLVSLKDEPIFAMTIPGKLQSYLAAGMPVLAMLNGEGAELLKDGKAGLTCAAGDAASLAQAVLQLANMSTSDRHAIGARGRALYDREFERGLLLDRIEGWLFELANVRRERR
ncbi:glycosyltransferase family 4 protein [Laribacter hongkongensis]|uniref:glycosyltransferase family 4 protein n=1 Tax=Laribacter hongkongensis TaxID=168471 RepID=UPI001EFCC4C5|nr:glycosyltransferase family 4 protein [Laribacter hongkongensis]MCG9022844.1 glycosyltransferase family 4 protein [Laribacter hongkongensis]